MTIGRREIFLRPSTQSKRSGPLKRRLLQWRLQWKEQEFNCRKVQVTELAYVHVLLEAKYDDLNPAHHHRRLISAKTVLSRFALVSTPHVHLFSVWGANDLCKMNVPFCCMLLHCI